MDSSVLDTAEKAIRNMEDTEKKIFDAYLEKRNRYV
jgi:hypothetical protein